jgi:spore coat polysaccharide biosynthesis protein SpsF (cytidylyltransferase family)
VKARSGPVAIIQARVGSTRLPGKVLQELAGTTVLEVLLQRCALSRRLAGILVATTELAADDPIADLARRAGVGVFRGSEHDVLDRYVQAQAAEAADTGLVMRLTADSPLTDPANIDEVILLHEQAPADYVCVESYPLGLGGAELMTAEALRRAHRETRPDETAYREHVTTYMKAHPGRFALRIDNASPPCHRPELRLTVDEPPDLELVRRVCDHFAPRIDFGTAEVIRLLDARPDLVALNAHVVQR